MARSKTSSAKSASAPRAREKIFAVAADLFYREGVRAVGVETIVKRAGVNKISLYRSFASKDDLVVAYLEDRARTFLRQWDEANEVHRDDPRAQLRTTMTYLAERTTKDSYRGCPFINFCGEFADRDHPGRQVARTVKAELRERFLHLAEALQVPRPRQLADGLLLLVEGAYAISQTLGGGPDGPGRALVSAAEALVDGQLRPID